MTGHVIDSPPRKHECAPGWEWRAAADGGRYGVPPSSWDYPKGTAWECDCGQVWISRGATAPNSPGFTWWRRQSRIAAALRSAFWRWR